MTDNLEIHKVKERIKMTNTKQTQDDRTVQPFNCSTIQRVKAYAFTLAETLIVIGIIGVVAALTLPNLNHATGDKETVTRLKKIHSTLNEANDRAVAIYGPVSEWGHSPACMQYSDNIQDCWPIRVSQFLKTSKAVTGSDIVLTDGTHIWLSGYYINCDADGGIDGQLNDICLTEFYVDINGDNKGKNMANHDMFMFMVSDSNGVIPYTYGDYESNLQRCLEVDKSSTNDYDGYCTFWVLDYGNLDYLKADEKGKCNDNPSIILDGVTNTSCH